MVKRLKQLQMVYVVLLLAPLMLTVQGCATAGYDGVDTTRKAILVSTAEVREANKLLQDLKRRNVIDSENASKALQSLRDAHALLQSALDAIEVAGDPVTAEGNLAKANTVITVVLALLAEFT